MRSRRSTYWLEAEERIGASLYPPHTAKHKIVKGNEYFESFMEAAAATLQE